jgi:MFS family permease
VTSLQTPIVAGQQPANIYNRTFWSAYAANVLLVTANALTFRFAEFVRFLGGTEELTGQIVSAGVVGALLSRFTFGRDIDGHGVRRMWIGSSLLFIAGGALLTFSHSLGWEIYAARIAFTVGLTSMFACSISHIQQQVPAYRRTEVLGSLGSSGFVGMIIGAQLGDLMFAKLPPSRELFAVLFGATALLGIGYLTIVLRLTRDDRHTRPRETLAAHRLIFRYWPGPVVLVAMMMGVGFVVTTVFLTRHATEVGLPGIRTFFTTYAVGAFLFRLVSRTWSRTLGRHRMILMGLAGHCVGHLALCPVTSEWHLIVPALTCGFGHAMLFPCVVSLGAGAFPPEYRGSGTTIILGFMDLGVFLSAPVLGRVIDTYGFTTMFLTSAVTAAVTGVVYAAATFRVLNADTDGIELRAPRVEPVEVAAQAAPLTARDPVLTAAEESA